MRRGAAGADAVFIITLTNTWLLAWQPVEDVQLVREAKLETGQYIERMEEM